MTDREVTCGLLGWRPQWLQKLANEHLFLVLFTVTSVTTGMLSSYTNAIITTIEKQFGISSTETAWIYSGNEISPIFLILFLPCIGLVKRKSLFMGLSLAFFFGGGTLLMTLPHFIRNSSYIIAEAKNEEFVKLCYHQENGTSNNETLTNSVKPMVNAQETPKDYQSMIIIFAGMFISGFGSSLRKVFGIPYLDDNAKNENRPMTLAIMWASGMLGPSLGFFLGSACLRIYVYPSAEIDFTEGDPRFIGAWWLGFIVLGSIMMFLSFFYFFFPPHLRHSKRDLLAVKEREISVKSFKESLGIYIRVAKTKAFMFNMFSALLYFFGIVGFSMFLPKFLEVHYGKKASSAGALTGVTKSLAAVAGTVISGYLIGKFRFHARKLVIWHIVFGLLASTAFIFFIFLPCNEVRVAPLSEVANSSCSASCSCPDVKIRNPLCIEGKLSSLSRPCDLGCTSVSDNGKNFLDCQCLLNEEYDTITEGLCQADCDKNFYTMLAILFAVSFFGATTRPSTSLIFLRSINPKDKSSALGMLTAAMTTISYLPAPFLYGYLVDNACVVWETSALDESVKKNCLVYDSDTFRININVATAIVLFLAVLCDIGVFLNVQELDVYEEEKDEKETTITLKV